MLRTKNITIPVSATMRIIDGKAVMVAADRREVDISVIADFFRTHFEVAKKTRGYSSEKV